jgi:hypothetical protein
MSESSYLIAYLLISVPRKSFVQDEVRLQQAEMKRVKQKAAAARYNRFAESRRLSA